MAWYEDMYRLVDQKDMNAVGAWYADDVQMIVGDGEPVVGRANVVESLQRFQSTVAGLAHTFTSVAEQGGVSMFETSTTFTLRSGGSVKVKGVTIDERRDGLITSQRMYADMAPLWAAQQAVLT